MTHYQLPVCQGGGAEKTSDGGGGDAGERGKGLTGLRQATINSNIFKILGEALEVFE